MNMAINDENLENLENPYLYICLGKNKKNGGTMRLYLFL